MPGSEIRPNNPMWRGLSLVSVLLVTLSGCAAPTLTSGGLKVKLMKADPPQDCAEVGSVYGGVTTGIVSLESSKVLVRNSAAAKGANYVRWDTLNEANSGIGGTAFSCP